MHHDPNGCVPVNGTLVRVTYDSRGLARVIDSEDGQARLEYLPDPARCSEYAVTGEREWMAPVDFEVVAA